MTAKNVLSALPDDWNDALLLGRLLLPAGPSLVLLRQGRAYDISAHAATSADFIVGWNH